MLDEKTKTLIAVGAAVTANCLSCLEVRAGKAKDSGATDEEILAAVEVARQVRLGAAGKLDRFATELLGGSPAALSKQGCC